MPGVRPSESWRDWNEQSFSQSGRDGGGVVGGVFISKIYSQSHAASHLWTYFVRSVQRPPGRAAKRDTMLDWPLRYPPERLAPMTKYGSFDTFLAPRSEPDLHDARFNWNVQSRNALTPASTSRSYRVCCERIPEAMHCIPAPAHRSRCRNDDSVATSVED